MARTFFKLELKLNIGLHIHPTDHAPLHPTPNFSKGYRPSKRLGFDMYTNKAMELIPLHPPANI